MRLMSALIVSAASFTWCGAASAHVVPVPQFVPSGTEAALRLAVPNERPEPMNGFSATVPSGFRIVEARPLDGWEAQVDGSTATWRGGPLRHLSIVTFVLRVDVSGDPGVTTLTTDALYPSGAKVTWPADMTVIPGKAVAGDQSQTLRAAAISGVVAILVILGVALLAGWQ